MDGSVSGGNHYTQARWTGSGWCHTLFYLLVKMKLTNDHWPGSQTAHTRKSWLPQIQLYAYRPTIVGLSLQQQLLRHAGLKTIQMGLLMTHNITTCNVHFSSCVVNPATTLMQACRLVAWPHSFLFSPSRDSSPCASWAKLCLGG